jgi:hypothetical protein
MTKNGSGSEVSNFQLSGKGFEARGTLVFGADRRLKTMDLEQLALRPGDQLSLSVVADDRGYDAKVRGAKLDARGIIKGIRAAAAGGAVDIFPIAISLDLDSVTGANNVSLSHVTGTMTVMKKGLDKVALKGRSGSDQPFEWTLGHDGGTRTLRFVAEGGGALIRFADIYTRISGGNLILDYSGPVGGVGNGVLVMRDFRLLGETALKPAINAASGAADPNRVTPANTEATDDLQFSQLKIPFRQEDWVITIVDAALRGVAWSDRKRDGEPPRRQACSQRGVYSSLRIEQHAGCDPAARRSVRRAQRGPFRHHLSVVRAA